MELNLHTTNWVSKAIKITIYLKLRMITKYLIIITLNCVSFRHWEETYVYEHKYEMTNNKSISMQIETHQGLEN